MSTPAGWYDDGSGRQRWWDGQQWTEHYAPETPAVDDAASASEAPAADTGSIDPVAAIDPIEPIAPISGISAPDAVTEQLPPYAAAEYTPPAAPAVSAPEYAGAAPVYPGATPAYPVGGYPAVDEGPKKMSVLGLVGLGLAVLGTILVFIPVIGFLGFILLAVAFILSIISLFLKGKKWPGIAGLSLSIVGTIIGIVMSIIYLATFAAGLSEEIANRPVPSPSTSVIEPEASEPAPSEGPVDTAERPTAEEVAAGLGQIIEKQGVTGYPQDGILCLAEAFVASDMSNEGLAIIASGSDLLTDPDDATAFFTAFTDGMETCAPQ